MNFIPDKTVRPDETLYFEDVRAADAPGYTTEQSERELMDAISGLLSKLGGSAVAFQSGIFDGIQGKPKRYGYVIQFQVVGNPARIVVAGLPLRNETAAKRQQVKAHALYAVREQLKAMQLARLLTPNSEPLAQYLVVDGQKTWGELIYERAALPAVTSGGAS